jgi:hypothetical protein
MSFIETLHPRLREVPDIDNTLGIVDGRQYEVVSGPVTYGTNTYTVGETFYGDAEIDTAYTGGNVKQVGAFVKSLPGHIGKHALMPYGLTYSGNGTVTSYYDTDKSIPMIVSCVPWMIDQGIYVAQPEFWTPDFIIEAQSAAQSKVLIAQAEAAVTPSGTTPAGYNCQGNPSDIHDLIWTGGPYSAGVTISGTGTTVNGLVTNTTANKTLLGDIVATICNPTNADVSILFTFSGNVTFGAGADPQNVGQVLISDDGLATSQSIARRAGGSSLQNTPASLIAPALSLTTFTLRFTTTTHTHHTSVTLNGAVTLSI